MDALQPDSTSTAIRLFAFGYDAYELLWLFPRFSKDPQYSFQGMTGTLYLSEDQRVYRRFLWAEFQNGLPVQKKS
jgi:outer membrane PBP1 activator LpoA protein